MKTKNAIGLEGEMECALQLEARGWKVTHLNAVQVNFPNADLLAEKFQKRRWIQVKASRKPKGYLTGGSVNPSVVAGGKIFNRVPLRDPCDHVVFLATQNTEWRHFIMPVASAEAIFRKNIDSYFTHPRLSDGLPRKAFGQADIFAGSGPFPHARIVPDQRDELLRFESSWEILDADEEAVI